jgi:hypothetical protein
VISEAGGISKVERLRRACLDLLREHERAGDIPTNGRFLFYELEQRGVVPKKYDGINPATGKKWARSPSQDIAVATMQLRESGRIPWHWIVDETRTLSRRRYGDSGGKEPPLLICESRATAGVLSDLAYEYLTPITATGGQCGGFIVTDIVPLLRGRRKVLYVGDHELRGPADQIESNTRRVIEKHTGRKFVVGVDWIKIALTERQVKASARLQRLSITKLDKRYKPPKEYEAIECEALGQGALTRLIRRHLDKLLPEPLERVRVREARQQAQLRAALAKLARRRHG